DPSGFGQGQAFLGSTPVTTDGSGDATFTATFPVPLAGGKLLTATATTAANLPFFGDTSEFSACVDVTSSPPPPPPGGGNAGSFQLSAATYSVNESGGTATVTVTRTGGSTGAVTVQFATSDGTATAGADYTDSDQTLTFNDGQTSRDVTIPISDDSLNEANETVNLSLSNPTGGAALASPSTAVLTILDN